RWTDPAVRTLMARLEMTSDADLARRGGDAYPCALHAFDRDGRRHEVEILQPPGASPDDLDARIVSDKFAAVTAHHLAADARRRIVDAIMGLDEATTCDALMRLLAPRNG